MKGEKEGVKNSALKNTTVAWVRARHLVVCLNVLAATSEVIVNGFYIKPYHIVALLLCHIYVHRLGVSGVRATKHHK